MNKSSSALVPALLALLTVATGCASTAAIGPAAGDSRAPVIDPRVGLAPGLFDAGEAQWNLRRISTTPPPEPFVGHWNSDLAFTGQYVIQGNFAGFQVWDVSNPVSPQLVKVYVCPGSQNDVSVHGNLLFLSVEGLEGRLDCGSDAPREAVSPDRFRGIRIFDISDVRNPRPVAHVQTCRGSHTHTLVTHPGDSDNVYVYVSGVTPARPAEELAGCSGAPLAEDPNSVLSRIDVIRVPLANPASAAIVSRPRILEGLAVPPQRTSIAPADREELEAARAAGAFIVRVEIFGGDMIIPPEMADPMLAEIVRGSGRSGPPTAADSAALRAALPDIIAAMTGTADASTICHDITVYPSLAVAAGACVGYGVLLNIASAVEPRRTAALADTNFIVWHSATFSNDGSKVLFTDEWGGGLGAKCRASDPREWGANAIYTLANGRFELRGYYKLPAAQSPQENCVAHNGSLIPIPGRDVMVQSWYQGGVSVFDWTDPARPFEIAFHDRGPVSAEQVIMGGSWSAYWYNGLIVSSEIARGLDIFELVPSEFLSANEIAAAKTVQFDQLNVQQQPRFTWPPSFVLARAYMDQLERSRGLSGTQLAAARSDLERAELAAGSERSGVLNALAARLDAGVTTSADGARLRVLTATVRELAAR